MGKEKGKIKRKGISYLAGPGRGDFGPLGRERAREGALAARLAQQRGGDGGGRRRGAGPTRQGEGGGSRCLNDDGEGEVDRSSTGGGIRGGSPPWFRFCGGEAVARHGRGQAFTGVGAI
jgi:hypothetical protein